MFKTKNLTLILIGIMLFSLLLTVVGITFAHQPKIRQN